MENKTKIGILKYIAGSSAKGIKFEDQPETWYNPSTEECKEMIREEFLGKNVEIVLVDKTKFSSMILLEEEKQEVSEEEAEPEKVNDSVPEKPKSSTKEEVGTINMDGESMPLFGFKVIEKFEPDYFKKLEKIEVESKTIGTLNLKYASWSEVWSKLKNVYPSANYHVHDNPKTGLPYFSDSNIGAFVKVTVTVVGISHTVFLPVMDNRNQSVKGVALDSMNINKSIQRAFAKAIAMHGVGLYIYKGEDFA